MDTELKLFAVLLGGYAKPARIELHDIVFTVGETLEAQYPYLIHQWFGQTKHLHVDSSAELSVVDGYKIHIVSQKPEQDEQSPSLYFVNFGGYNPKVFGESHEMSFYVGHNRKEITAKAKQDLCVGQHQQHCDDSYAIEVDDIVKVDQIGQHYIKLEPTTLADQIDIQSHYRRIDVPDILAESERIKSSC
ncbi:MAG: DUF1543 domain-containing protein [Pseudomonadota bacterium]